MKKYQHLLIDLDGTIINSQIGVTKSVEYALRHFGIHVPDIHALNTFIGPPLKDSFIHFYHFTEEQAQQAVSKYRERYAQTGVFENELYPGMKEFLKKANEKGYKLMVATSKPTVFAKQILDHLEISHEFKCIMGSGLDGSLHTKTEVIRHLLQLNNMTHLSDIVMIGDRKYDILGAKDIGIDSIGVLYGFGSFEELQQAQANYIVEDVDQLRDLLHI